MYILRNAWKSISRSKGRNILIGIITLVIAVSACIGLSIRQAADDTKKDTLDQLTVTGTISFDRQAMMGNMNQSSSEESGGFDKEKFSSKMGEVNSLTLDEYKKYAKADSVKDFYYTLTASFNGSDNFEPVSNEEVETTATTTEETTQSSETKDSKRQNPNGDMGIGGAAPEGDGGEVADEKGQDNPGKRMMSRSDFSIVGYSSESAMTDFVKGTATISSGEMFKEGSTDRNCIISKELATYNNLSVGDTITITNPNQEEETYELTVCGIYQTSESNDSTASEFGGFIDPANKIYMSDAALQSILDDSTSNATTETDENTGKETSTAITGRITPTYVFASKTDYEKFEDEVRTLGLDESYTVSSSDLSSYESSIKPLETLSTMAGWFLLVILIIGAVILIVLNIFNVRERKYEIGVLTAMGMKKWKVAVQFMIEIFFVTMISIILGAGIGAVSSMPVTNKLLESQVASQKEEQSQVENNFGRKDTEQMNKAPDKKNPMNPNNAANAVEYISQVNSAMNLTVVLQMIGIGLLLTLVASMVSILFVMRYNPLKILANRD